MIAAFTDIDQISAKIYPGSPFLERARGLKIMEICIGKVAKGKKVHLAAPGSSHTLCSMGPFEPDILVTEEDHEFLKNLKDRYITCEKCIKKFEENIS